VLGAGLAAQVQHVRVHGMAAAFTAAAIFDAVALIVIAVAIRMRPRPEPAIQPGPAESDVLTAEELEAEFLESEAI
jgi:hypothetical protein